MAAQSGQKEQREVSGRSDLLLEKVGDADEGIHIEEKMEDADPDALAHPPVN